MRIGMVLDKRFPPDARVENEAGMLIQAGYSVLIVCYPASGHNHSNHKGIKLVEINRPKKWIRNGRALIGSILDVYTKKWASYIHQFIEDNKIDILHVHDLYMALAAIQAAGKSGVPIIVDLHENYPAAIRTYNWANKLPHKILVRPQQWRSLEERIFRQIDGLIVLSEYYKNQLMQRYPFLNESQFVVYPNLPSIKEFEQYPILDDLIDTSGRFTLLYFGAIAERRGIFTVLEALPRLVAKIPEILVLLIGPVDKADQTRFKNYLHNPELQGHIIHYRWKDIRYLPSYITKSDVCLSPIIKNEQHESGVANKIFQYMLFEKPLLVSNCVPQEEIVNKYQCGLSFESQSTGDLIEKTLILYNNRNLRQTIGKNGRTAVLEKYNVEEYSKYYIEQYQIIYNSMRK
ncbi:MAG TPA: glycosyltransferase [Bacteroidetes bacterium]|nr:glycosyltransferase [Bacteroidota bacterium]